MNLDSESSDLLAIIHQDDLIGLVEVLKAHPKLCKLRNIKKQSLLHLAVSNMSNQIVKYLCETSHTEFINAVNGWGETALHVAVGMGESGLVQILCRTPSLDQSIKDQWGRTAIDLAIEMGSHSLIDAGLLSKDHISNNREEVLETMAASEVMKDTQCKLANELKIMMENKKSSSLSPAIINVRGIFQDTKETINGDSTGVPSQPQPLPSTININTNLSANFKKIALSRLIEFPGDPEMLRTYLSERDKYDVNGKDMFGSTALHKLAAWNKVDLLEILLTHPDLDINSISSTIGSALHSAIDMNAIKAAKMILSLPNFDLTIRDKKGRTALDLAKENNLEEIKNIIENKFKDSLS